MRLNSQVVAEQNRSNTRKLTLCACEPSPSLCTSQSGVVIFCIPEWRLSMGDWYQSSSWVDDSRGSNIDAQRGN
ncbi:uncharacterized protein N7525_003727 [Penicillium rubens]|uniref:uncharacterized protein n=1 Tax=Penicillium rubens TaxID=1108849 RepID=UPI002A59D83C|nr:uncharacterized protein N7525_003727 [Penicillium rubens]KAJ5838539.1 hypothetical protein N7525_003727 [Penicillium rubens]KAJ5866590.1 hypothetical protein N7534_001143 [Penicillium rubens]